MGKPSRNRPNKERVPQTEPYTDKQVVGCASHEPGTSLPCDLALPANQFNNVIRCLLRADVSKVLQMRNYTHGLLKELGEKRNAKAAAKRTPKGSDHCDFQSIFRWGDRLRAADKTCEGYEDALDQLVTIDATAVARGT